MTLRTVGSRYSMHNRDERAALLDAAAALIERAGYDAHHDGSGLSIIGAVSRAAAVYSDSSEAFRDGMFLVNSRFLICTSTPARPSTNADVAWVTWTRSLDQHEVVSWLRETAALVRDA
jgi:hypothetical protein